LTDNIYINYLYTLFKWEDKDSYFFKKFWLFSWDIIEDDKELEIMLQLRNIFLPSNYWNIFILKDVEKDREYYTYEEIINKLYNDFEKWWDDI